jgi:ribose 5-phosphate isomerase B
MLVSRMKLALAADHAGFLLKERLREKLIAGGHQVTDYGTDSEASVDYPDFASAVARDVAEGRAERGILVCSSGVGMAISANKVPGIRAAVGTSEDQVAVIRGHNDANVLSFGATYTGQAQAERMVDVFLTTDFDGGRHERRIAKIRKIECMGR